MFKIKKISKKINNLPTSTLTSDRTECNGGGGGGEEVCFYFVLALSLF